MSRLVLWLSGLWLLTLGLVGFDSSADIRALTCFGLAGFLMAFAAMRQLLRWLDEDGVDADAEAERQRRRALAREWGPSLN